MLSESCFFLLLFIVVVDDDNVWTDLVVCLILKISMNVTLVTTPVQQNKYVSISREATHAWILYSAPLHTSKLVTSECSVHHFHLHTPQWYPLLLSARSPCGSPLRSQCMCSAENPACRDKPFTILYRHMDLSSGRSVPADIFQMQATTRYPGAFYIFQIKSGNDGREFYMRVSGCFAPSSALRIKGGGISTEDAVVYLYLTPTVDLRWSLSSRHLCHVQRWRMNPIFSMNVVLTKIAQRLKWKVVFKNCPFFIPCTFYFSSIRRKVHIRSYTIQPEGGANARLMWHWEGLSSKFWLPVQI